MMPRELKHEDCAELLDRVLAVGELVERLGGLSFKQAETILALSAAIRVARRMRERQRKVLERRVQREVLRDDQEGKL